MIITTTELTEIVVVAALGIYAFTCCMMLRLASRAQTVLPQNAQSAFTASELTAGKHDSIGKTGKHNPECEGEVQCPTTGKDECGKIAKTKNDRPTEVKCFACGKTHKVN